MRTERQIQASPQVNPRQPRPRLRHCRAPFNSRRLCAALVLLATSCPAVAVTPDTLNGLTWRSIGPAVMGGRISDIAGVPGDPTTLYAASGSGGLFRTLDGGLTWNSIFDRQSTISIGAIATQPGNPKVVWVGTGESNVRNSVSFGDGVYRTGDGGTTWLHLGLSETQTISRIVLHPTNPAIAWVAALGHPFGANAERGIFMTTDAGRTWNKTLFIDDEHGAADLEIDPRDPAILYAAMWRFERKLWTFTSGSDKGGVFQSLDGGRTWKKLTGLPKSMGRIGVKVSPANPDVVYVIAESNEGVLFRSADRGKTFARVSDDKSLVGRGYYYADLRAAPDSENHVIALTDSLMESRDAGKTFRRMSPRTHGDLHALWIDPKDPRRIWQGHDGGLGVSYDGGAHWEQINNIPLGQFYRVSADDRQPFYNLTGGSQDNGTWTGPVRTREPAGIYNDDWRMVNGTNGFFSMADPDDPDILITEQAGGVLLRTDMRTREQQQLSPQPRSNAGGPAADMKVRFNWNAPLIRSPQRKNTIYLAGNVIYQSSDGGKNWETISQDLTTSDTSRLGNVGGPVWIENSAAEVYSTITALAESPVKRGVIWAGTDDGNLQVTTDAGKSWTNVASKLPGVPARSAFSHVEASRTSELVAYATLDRHMSDDFRPYIYKTSDGGKTWLSISHNLPAQAYVWVLREDPKNPSLLYAGTELGLYASFDAGGSWVPLHLKNLPWSISVRDILVHPTRNDLIVATHGRSLWVLDDATPLQRLASAGATELFEIRPALRHATRATRFGIGDKTFAAPNPQYGALITYLLPGNTGSLSLQILNGKGDVVQELAAGKEPGLNRAAWDLRYGPRGPQALPGAYTARLVVDGRTLDRKLDLHLDPALDVTPGELQTQFDTASETLKMRTGVAESLAKLAALRGRNQAAADALSARLTRPIELRRTETGPRLLENLDTLFAQIDGVDAAPTPALLRYFGELQNEYRERMRDVDNLLRATSN